MNIPIKRLGLFSKQENPLLALKKTWDGDVWVSTELIATPMHIKVLNQIIIPTFSPKGPISVQREAKVLTQNMKNPTDIYLVSVTTPAGIVKHGMLAMPKAKTPTLFVIESI